MPPSHRAKSIVRLWEQVLTFLSVGSVVLMELAFYPDRISAFPQNLGNVFFGFQRLC